MICYPPLMPSSEGALSAIILGQSVLENTMFVPIMHRSSLPMPYLESGTQEIQFAFVLPPVATAQGHHNCKQRYNTLSLSGQMNVDTDRQDIEYQSKHWPTRPFLLTRMHLIFPRMEQSHVVNVKLCCNKNQQQNHFWSTSRPWMNCLSASLMESTFGSSKLAVRRFRTITASHAHLTSL